MSFQIIALPESEFSHYFSLSDQELEQHKAKRIVVKDKPGVPCRVTLDDAEVGESVLLINYQHQVNGGAYQASHAIFVRENQRQAKLGVGVVPESIQQRLISARAFDSAHDMIAADVVDGQDLATKLNEMLADNAVSYIHLHNAKPGCYAAKVVRADS